ncbi:MAG: Gfo/Idh/MocA family oxidoreductase, partial [Saprospiraceae bacterium]|nr:Gfo/Idh/MocA family oxidoreductase [Saprospiraceae bacterium]
MNIVIIGSGNVGTHIAKRLDSLPDTQILQIISRTYSHARRLARGFGAEYSDTLEDLNTDLDICIIATSDNAIADVVEKMPVFVGEKVICHTS